MFFNLIQQTTQTTMAKYINNFRAQASEFFIDTNSV